MARFAPVVPTQILRKFKEYGQLGDYHLLLAHDIVAKPNEYAEIFSRPTRSSMTIILDNSVIELGGAVDLKVITDAAQIVRPTTTVLPDVLLDTPNTITNCHRALEPWTEAFFDMGLQPDFLIVPQGITLGDWIHCAESFAHDERINFWGIPRNVVKYVGSRRDLVDIVHAINPSRAIHLLGFSDNVVDDILAARHHLVDGIDSAVPIRAVSAGISVSLTGTLNAMPPRGDWWETATYTPVMLNALETARNWVQQ